MGADTSQSNFRRGVMSLVILTLLKRGDMYGYQLVQEIAKTSGGRIITQEGSLYPVLYKLLDQELISDREVLVGKRMKRVYYHLEPAGDKRREELTREYQETTQGVFQIIKGSEGIVECCESSAVSVGDISAVAGQLDAEEKNIIQNTRFDSKLSF